MRRLAILAILGQSTACTGGRLESAEGATGGATEGGTTQTVNGSTSAGEAGAIAANSGLGMGGGSTGSGSAITAIAGRANVAGMPSGGSAGGGAITTTMSDVLAACAVPVADLVTPTSKAQFDALLTGDWYQCGNTSMFCEPHAGVRIGADGTLSILEYFESIVVPLEVGTWDSYDTTGMNGPGVYQFNWTRPSGGGNAAFPKIAEGGRMVQISTSMVGCTGTYVKSTALQVGNPSVTTVSGVPVETKPISTTLSANSAAMCDPNLNSFDLTSLGTMLTSLRGVWMLCKDPSPGCAIDEVGVEFAADGVWHRLYADAAGKLYRGLDWGRRGKYAVIDTSVMNPPQYYQLNISTYGTVANNPLPSYQITPPGALTLTYAGSCKGFYQKLAP